MSLPVVWLSAAARELEQARAWYTAIRPDLGDRFALAVSATLDLITAGPARYAAIYRGRRRTGVRRFPYGIIYEIQDQRILVIACFHNRRDPERWQSR